MTCLCVRRILGVFIYFFPMCFLAERVSTHTLIVRSPRHRLRDFRISAFRSLILDWSSAMLLLKILLLREVCTLLPQMETLQSRHLPAQMDWLSVACAWRQQNRSVVHLCALCGMEGHRMAEADEHPGCARTECLVVLIARSSLRIWVMSNLPFW